MPEKREIHAVLENYPKFSQDLSLICRQCRKTADYNVGTILCAPGRNGAADEYGFANYFRCQECGSAGPWDVADVWKVYNLRLKAKTKGDSEGFRQVRCALFDGTLIQAPAMGEEYLLKLIQKDPANGFLCSRLGNVLRNCGEKSKAIPWYEKSLSLNPHDLEARYELLVVALETDNPPEALVHARELIGSLLAGHKTENEKVNADIALSVAEDLRNAGELLQQHFLAEAERNPNSKELTFVRTLLEREGDEKEIVHNAATRLLAGKAEPDHFEPRTEEEEPATPVELCSSLQEAADSAKLNGKNLTVAIGAIGTTQILVVDRYSVPITDGVKMTRWKVPSLTALFRGSQAPPPDMDYYPPAYTMHFYFIERHFVALCDTMGDRTDQEMHEIYATLRRRPDGRSLGVVHDFFWQVTALLLGHRVLSAAEYDALFGALARSTRKWSVAPVSRNYIAYLRAGIEA